MDSIIKKLSEIESSAAAIVQHAEAQKAVLDEEYQEARQKFDHKLEAETQSVIQKIRKELEHKRSSLLASQTEENNLSIAALKKEYEENHTHYAQEILKRITEV
jgi:F0F1-type ATP synthase membrane subunit b/b'